MQVTIRAAVATDVDALAELSKQLGYPADAQTMRARLARVHSSGAGCVFVAVGASDCVLGWTHVVPRLQLEDAPFAELAGLVVDAGARNVGIGAALLHAAENWARENDFSHLRVRSNVVRARAHRFYLREGYAERKRQAVFVKEL